MFDKWNSNSGGMVIVIVRKCDTFASMFEHCKIQILLFVKCVGKGNNTKSYRLFSLKLKIQLPFFAGVSLRLVNYLLGVFCFLNFLKFKTATNKICRIAFRKCTYIYIYTHTYLLEPQQEFGVFSIFILWKYSVKLY